MTSAGSPASKSPQPSTEPLGHPARHPEPDPLQPRRPLPDRRAPKGHGGLPWDGTDATGRTGGHQTAGQVGPGRRSQVTGHPTVGHPTVGHPTAGHRTVGHRTGRGTGPGGHQWWTRTGSGRCGGQLGLPDHGGALRPEHRPEAPPSGRCVGRSAAGTAPQATTLPRAGHRRDQAIEGDTPPSGGALAHCCRVLELEGTRRGQWDEGKLRCAGSGWVGSADGGAYEDGRGWMCR
jgi:hypothetical protein